MKFAFFSLVVVLMIASATAWYVPNGNECGDYALEYESCNAFPDPCNGGSCMVIDGKRHCCCAPRFTGDDCSIPAPCPTLAPVASPVTVYVNDEGVVTLTVVGGWFGITVTSQVISGGDIIHPTMVLISPETANTPERSAVIVPKPGKTGTAVIRFTVKDEDPLASCAPYSIDVTVNVVGRPGETVTCPVGRLCFNYNFDELPAGPFPLNTYFAEGGLSVKTNGTGYSLQVFNTSEPGVYTDLGSPNSACNPNPGPGFGSQTGENCIPAGNALVVFYTVRPSSNVGTIVLDFAPAGVTVNSVSILAANNTRNNLVVSVRNADNSTTRNTVPIPNRGSNGFQEITLSQFTNVYKIQINFYDRAGLVGINYCINDNGVQTVDLLEDNYYIRSISRNNFGEFESAFNPRQVSVTADSVAFNLSSKPCWPDTADNTYCQQYPAVSGELWSEEYFMYGDVVFTAQPPSRPGVISSVFTMHASTTDERPVWSIILSFGGVSQKARTSVITNIKYWDRITKDTVDSVQVVDLGFDWSTTTTEYRIRWTESGITWFANNVALRRETKAHLIPAFAGRVYAHNWAVVSPARDWRARYGGLRDQVGTYTSSSPDAIFRVHCLRIERFNTDVTCAPGSNSPVCPKPGDTLPNGTPEPFNSPNVKVFYDNRQKFLSFKIVYNHYPNGFPIFLLTSASKVPAIRQELMTATFNQSKDLSCFASTPSGLSADRLTCHRIPNGNCRLGQLYDEPWLIFPVTNCTLEARLTVPYETLLGCSNFDKADKSDGAVIDGVMYAATVKTCGTERGVSETVVPFKFYFRFAGIAEALKQGATGTSQVVTASVGLNAGRAELKLLGGLSSVQASDDSLAVTSRSDDGTFTLTATDAFQPNQVYYNFLGTQADGSNLNVQIRLVAEPLALEGVTVISDESAVSSGSSSAGMIAGIVVGCAVAIVVAAVVVLKLRRKATESKQLSIPSQIVSNVELLSNNDSMNETSAPPAAKPADA